MAEFVLFSLKFSFFSLYIHSPLQPYSFLLAGLFVLVEMDIDFDARDVGAGMVETGLEDTNGKKGGQNAGGVKR